MDVLCMLHEADEYGLLRWPLADIAKAAGANLSHLKELTGKQVFRGSDKALEQPDIYVPRHGRKNGDPVILLAPQAGPLWYSKRMVRDEYVRTIRGESSRFGVPDDEASKTTPKAAPKPTFGDGSSSSSSATQIPSEAKASGAGAPPDPADVIFALGVPLLTASGVSDRNARSMLGLLRKRSNDLAVIDALQRCASEKPMQPVSWLQAVLGVKASTGKHAGFASKNYREGITEDGSLV
jgi:hypothetical protein